MKRTIAQPKIAVLLPAYNEEETVAHTILDFFTTHPTAAIWVIDNASTDNTKQVALQCFRDHSIEGGLLEEFRRGKSLAVRKGFMEVDADVFVLADADMTYPAKDLQAMIQPILADEADVTVGNRHIDGQYKRENKRQFHYFGNWIVRWLVNILYGSKLKDIMSGYRAFSRAFVEHYPVLTNGFELETDMTLFALDKRLRIKEVAIEYKDRPTGSYSKLSTFRDGFRVLFCIFQLFRYYRPLFFFSIGSTLFGIAGFVLSIPVWQDWFRYQYIYHVPLAILASTFEVVALIALSIGLILDAINRQAKIEFEQKWYKTIRKYRSVSNL